MSRGDDSLRDFDDALRDIERRAGRDHPVFARIEGNRALALVDMLRFDDALASARHAVAVAEATTGPDSDLTGLALGALQVSLTRSQKFDEALVVSAQCIAQSSKHDGPRSYNVASDLNNRGNLLSMMGRTDEALKAFDEATAIWTEVVGPYGLDVGLAQLNEANALLVTSRFAELGAPAARAVAILSKTPESRAYPKALIALGAAQQWAHQWAAAKDSLTRGLASYPSGDDPAWLANGHKYLALTEIGLGNRAAAREQVLLALDLLRKDVVHDPPTRDQLERMLATLGGA
jgi:tetratricopeptide (TPR) repeat protein